MGCTSRKQRQLMKTLQLGKGMITTEEIEAILIKTSFEEIELYYLLKMFLKLGPNTQGKLKNSQLMELDCIKHSPFGTHFLEAFGLKKTKKNNTSSIRHTDRGLVHKEDENEDDDNDNEYGNEINSDNGDMRQLEPTLFELPDLYSPAGDDQPSITFGIFCGIMKIFSPHVTIDEKASVYFKLYDFDNDGKITYSDLEQYFKNLNKDICDLNNNNKPKEPNNNNLVRPTNPVATTEAPLETPLPLLNLRSNPPRRQNEDVSLKVGDNEDNEDGDGENNEDENEGNMNDEDKEGELEVPEEEENEEIDNYQGNDEEDNKRKAEEEEQAKRQFDEEEAKKKAEAQRVIANQKRMVNATEEDKIIKESEANQIKQIIHLIIKETASPGHDYIDYFDFRNQMINTQFLPDYNNFIYFKDYDY